jgi:hypothetical protein
MFSRSATYLRHNSMNTPSSASTVWANCYHPTPQVIRLYDVANWKAFIKPHLKDLERKTDYRSFKFERNDKGIVDCYVKHKMDEFEDTWLFVHIGMREFYFTQK